MILTITFDARSKLGIGTAKYTGFAPKLPANEVECSPEQFDTFDQWKLAADGETILAATQSDLAPTADQLVAYARTKQASIAVGGISVNVAASGATPELALADTNLEGRLNLSGLVQLASLDPSFSTVWVQSTGNLTLSATQITTLGVAVGKFVEQTFQAFAQVLAAIIAGTITTTAAVDSAAWPATSV